jgi:phosphoesterase RecJ-like protein
MRDVLAVPVTRRAPLEHIARALRDATRIVLTTHVNADGDGAGSECAVAAWLSGEGKVPRIVNPTPFPEAFAHLVGDPAWVADAATDAGAHALADAHAFLVLDTAEPKRIGRIAAAIGERPLVVMDHHPASDNGLAGLVLQDASACATGELVYDLLRTAGPTGPWPSLLCEAVYTAIMTDTGSFRFSNTSPRAHAIAGDLIARGVEPEQVYRRIYGTVPLARVTLLRHALERLRVDDALPIAWLSIERGVMEDLGCTTDDLEGVIEHARSIRGTEVALLFRETADGSTKVSLRSNGAVDVNAIARSFGGGGHIKAAGALIGERMETARPRVLDAVRDAVRSTVPAFRGTPDTG